MRDTILRFTQPDLDETELLQIREALQSGWITTGPKVQQFEAEFGHAVSARHCIALNSGTAAMHLALEALGLKPGDEVITSPYTFAATAEVIRYFNARPVFVDVHPATFNIDPNLIQAAIGTRTRAIIPVHIGGLPADMDPILALAHNYDLVVIEDAAHAFPARYNGQKIGSLGSFTCFSFYATKPITTGEGGMICTQDDDWADRCRVMALHGISQDAWKRYTAEGSWYYEIIAPGYKYNMTDIAAAMGLAQLAKADQMWRRRREIAQRYNEAFGAIPQLQIPRSGLPDSPTSGPQATHAWHLYMLRLHLHKLSIDRAGFIDQLKQRHIVASVHFIPLHTHPYYCQTYGYRPEDFPVAYGQYRREISLPIYSKMSDQDLRDVVAAVVDIAHKFRL